MSRSDCLCREGQTPTLCRNGLHQLDPGHPWNGPDGRRCRECHLERKRRGTARWYAGLPEFSTTRSERVHRRLRQRIRARNAAQARRDSLVQNMLEVFLAKHPGESEFVELMRRHWQGVKGESTP